VTGSVGKLGKKLERRLREVIRSQIPTHRGLVATTVRLVALLSAAYEGCRGCVRGERIALAAELPHFCHPSWPVGPAVVVPDRSTADRKPPNLRLIVLSAGLMPAAVQDCWFGSTP